MKHTSNPFFRPLVFVFTLASTALLPGIAAAGTLYWDGDGTGASGDPPTSGVGGSGTWSSAGTQWWTGTAYQAWNGSGGQDIADFRGASGATITVSGTVNVNTMNITAASTTFSSGTIQFGSAGVIDTFTTAGNIFNSSLSGAVKFQATGSTATSGGSPVAFINGSNAGLTSLEVSLNTNDNPFYTNNADALGGAGTTFKLTKGLVGLGNGTSVTARTYNVGTIDLAGGILRARFDAATFTGATSLSANSQIMTRNATGIKLVFSNTINLNANTLNVMASSLSSGIELNGAISGTGNITMVENIPLSLTDNGKGTTTLGAANTFSGTATTTQNLGTLALGNVNALQNATLDTGLSGTQAVTFTVAGTNTYHIGALTGSDALALGANSISVGNKAVNTVFNADISGNGGLTKVGSNQLTLGAATSYTGGTTVTGGTLLVNNTTGSGTGTGTVSVTGGALGGTGSISGAVNVSTAGTINPGISGPGEITLHSGLTLAGLYQWQLGALSTSSPGTDFDRISITTGNADITGSSLGLSLGSFTPSADPFWQTQQTWAGILNNTGGGSLTGSFDIVTSQTPWSSLGSFSTTYTGNDVNLVWTPVPEPRSVILAGLLLGPILFRRRR